MLVGAGTTFADILFERGRDTPFRPAYAIYATANDPPTTLTFGALDVAARALAGRMAARATQGDRVLLLVGEIADFLHAFFACLYAGLVAVPTHLSSGRSVEQIRALIAHADPRLIVAADAEILYARSPVGDAVRPFADRLLLLDGHAAGTVPLAGPKARADDLALLQFTSGSTGRPRGVMISHANLIANANALRSLCDLSPGNWVVSWLPLFHDMGLMGGMLQPLFAGASCALMPPAAFVLRPRRWLALIDRLRAFACAAPNFAFDLCVERITEADREGLDLSCWQVALCGAEPVRAETLARFAAAFGPAGFRAETLSPCYGLAEATLAVTGARPGVRPRLLDVDAEMLRTGRVRSARRGAPGGRRTLVGCGAPLPGISLAIVDPATGERAPPGQTGEIWIAGDQVSIGYWRDPEASARRMGAALADAPGLRWLCSGDIGFQEGEDLFVLGRIDDMILVRGRNHAPQDIEHTVEKSGCALRPNSTVAFLGAGAASDGIVVVAEVNQRAAAEGPAILRAVRAAVAAEHGLELVGLALLKPNGLARTTSGKVRRAPTAAAWRDGSLPVLFRWEARPAKADLPPRPDGPADAGLILRWLTARCAQALGLDEASMDADALVVDLGLGSQQALVIASDLSDWLGRPVAPTILIEEGLTLALLAQRQAGRAVPGEEVRPVALVDQPEGRA